MFEGNGHLGEVRVLGHAQRALLNLVKRFALASVPALIRRFFFLRLFAFLSHTDLDHVLVKVKRHVFFFDTRNVSLELVRFRGFLGGGG